MRSPRPSSSFSVTARGNPSGRHYEAGRTVAGACATAGQCRTYAMEVSNVPEYDEVDAANREPGDDSTVATAAPERDETGDDSTDTGETAETGDATEIGDAAQISAVGDADAAVEAGDATGAGDDAADGEAAGSAADPPAVNGAAV